MPQRGTYQTRQQEAVCALFASRPEECLTAEEAYQALFKAGSDVSKTTVYRAISRLCQTGRLRRYAPHESGEAARYQHSPCTQSHLHIRCVEPWRTCTATRRRLLPVTLASTTVSPWMKARPSSTAYAKPAGKNMRNEELYEIHPPTVYVPLLRNAALRSLRPVRPCLGSAAVHRVHDLPCL